MWFKQVQLFQIKNTTQLTMENLSCKLAELAFRPCLPSMPDSIGWVSPIDDEDAEWVLSVNGYLMFCFQVEEKILPATVIRYELNQKIKQIEAQDERKVRQREKMALKDELMMTLLPRAFTKHTRYYAYIDTRNHYLILNTTQTKITEKFLSLFKKSVMEEIYPIELKKLSPIVTHWLKTQNYPSLFSIEKSCMLQDPEQENRVIRCREQDLFSNGIQILIKEGCEVKQLALSWQDRVYFVLSADNFSFSSIRYEEEITAQASEMEAETKKQQFIADFFIMSAALSEMFSDLMQLFEGNVEKPVVAAVA